MPKEINPKLTDQQKKVMFEEATESPGSSELNFEKREGDRKRRGKNAFQQHLTKNFTPLYL